MIAVDSSSVPTAAQVAAARAAGVQAWLGYIAEKPNDDIADPWPASAFAAVRASGLLTGAYCSGLDDPGWVKAAAAALGIVAILDDETSVRGDGPWVDPWLAASGTGLYGGSAVQTAHQSHGHPFYIAALYPQPAVTQTALWPASFAVPSPARPLGWQYGGDWTMPYGNVDVCNFDPLILEPPGVTDMGYTAAIFYAGIQVVFEVDGDGVMWQRYWTSTSGGYQAAQLPAGAVTVSAIVDTVQSQWHVYALGTDGSLLHWYASTSAPPWYVGTLPGASAVVTVVEPGPEGPQGPPGKVPTSATITGPIEVQLSS
jgi:hypothetical protein